jgi:serine phosphatase RsbU (regulator of sigma subunit)/pSer/pThr/pTyr-binding forkhead associated (FHA) protein
MMFLVVLEGPQQGRQFPLTAERARIGRERDADICLPGQLVSRNHAQIQRLGTDYLVEDLGSRNGTLLNGHAVTGPVPLTPRDRLEIGEFTLGLCPSPTAVLPESNLIIREQVSAAPSNAALFAQNPAQKLQVVLEIAQELGTAPDPQALLDNLLGHLLRLFPAADRGLVLLCEQDHLVVRAQRSRRDDDSSFPYSRTIVNKSLADGVGILSLDVRSDERFGHIESLAGNNLNSVLCVPLIAKDKRRLGVLQLDRAASGSAFQGEDLRMLTTLALQVSVVLENAGLQAERLRQEVLRKELAVAQEIQRGFLPSDFATPPGAGYELFACLHPAREVSGDLYDFFPLPDGRLALFVGDVSGKGMPAALFMVAVRTLARHLAPLGSGPAETLTRLNDALAADNPSLMFVTLAYAIYEPPTGETVLAAGGHPPPLLWRPDGRIDEVELPPGRVLGYPAPGLRLGERRLTLAPGEALAFYSDGFTEAFAPDGERMFGVEGLQSALRAGAGLMLAEAGARARDAVRQFTASRELQDDQALLLLRRL